MRIRDTHDARANEPAPVSPEIRKLEHSVRDAHIKSSKLLGHATPKFAYEIYGLCLPVRPIGAYRYVALSEEGVTPLLSVRKCFGRYKTQLLTSDIAEEN